MSRGLVVVPVHNEEAALPRVAAALEQAPEGCAALFVDDGSADGSRALLARLGCDVVRHPINLGYIEALQTGIEIALRDGRDFVVFFDGDGQHREEDLHEVVAHYRSHPSEVDVVVGSRLLAGGGAASITRRIGSRLMYLVARVLTGLRTQDVTSGMKLLTRRAMEVTRSAILEDGHAELLAYYCVCGLKIEEVPIQVEERSAGRSMYGIWKAVIYPLRTAYLILNVMLHKEIGKGNGT